MIWMCQTDGGGRGEDEGRREKGRSMRLMGDGL